MRLRLVLFLFCPLCWVGASGQASVPAISVNPAALEFAQQLIREGRVRFDQKRAWKRDQPSIAQKNDFIRAYGLEEYSKWHLGIDNGHHNGSKAHYKFPLGDFNAVHRCGLLAVKARAHEYGYTEIEAAAVRLVETLESISPGRQKHVD